MGDHKGPRHHDVPCKGCGDNLPQLGIKGSLTYYHDECRTVAWHWQRLEKASEAKARYAELKRRGAYQTLAMFGCTSDSRFDAAIAAMQEAAE